MSRAGVPPGVPRRSQHCEGMTLHEVELHVPALHAAQSVRRHQKSSASVRPFWEIFAFRSVFVFCLQCEASVSLVNFGLRTDQCLLAEIERAPQWWTTTGSLLELRTEQLICNQFNTVPEARGAAKNRPSLPHESFDLSAQRA